MGQLDFPQRSFMAASPKTIGIASKEAVTVDLPDCQSPLAQWFNSSSNAGVNPQQTLQTSEWQPVVADQSASNDADASSANFEAAQVSGTNFEAVPWQPFCAAAAVQPAGFVANAMPWGAGSHVLMVPIVGPGMQPSMPPTILPMQSNMHLVVQPPAHVMDIHACGQGIGFFDAQEEYHNSSSSPTRSGTGSGDYEQDTQAGSQKVEEPEHDAGRRLSASASRRRRRQRAAAHAKAAVSGEEYFQQGKTTVPEAAYASTSLPSDAEKRHGNLLSKLEAGGSDRAAALFELQGSVRRLAFDATGCRVLQYAFEVASHQEALKLVAELHGYVPRAITSPHANFVIQKIIEVMPMPLSGFIIHELCGHVAEVSRHRFGCRIICRLLEHSASDPMLKGLIDEILNDVGELSRHSFGHYVIECLLEHGLPDQKHIIALAIYEELFRNATNRHATYVVESALKFCSPADRNVLVAELLWNQDTFLCLAEHPSGFFVVKALVRHTDEASKIRSLLSQASSRILANPNGHQLLGL